jgi:ribosomal protein S18 acetylase RimI-like enzyme
MIKSLDDTSFDNLHIAFSKAFEDYKFQISYDQLFAMLKRRGFNPKLSFADFDNDEITAFTFNGIGIFQDKKTAYDTGTGTLPNYRQQGLANRIFTYSIPFLKENMIEQYLLEVLQENSAAISVYQKLGFSITREFNYYHQPINEILFSSSNIPIDITIAVISPEIMDVSFHDFNPSWQNSLESITRSKETFKILGAFYNDHLIGYCATEPATGDISQIAVKQNFRRQGLGTALLQQASGYSLSGTIKIVNTDPNCCSLNGFLSKLNIPLRGKQFEMIKIL